MKYYTRRKKARPDRPPVNIEDFPLDILRQIVWLLPIEEAAQTSILSRQWRYLWLSNPNWNLTPLTVQSFGRNEWKKFEKIVTDVIFRHSGSGIRKIRICHLNLNGALTCSTGIWMERLATHHPITDLEIDFGHSSAPPPALFSCESLVSLQLVFYGEEVHVTVPNEVKLSMLKKMSVRGVIFSNSDEFQRLLNGCRALETMELDSFHCIRREQLDVKIDLPELKVFRFDSRYDFVYIYLSAKNLEILEFSGKHLIIPDGFSFSKIKEVQGVELEQWVRPYLMQKRENQIRRYGEKMNNILHALSKTKTLSLGEWCTEHLTTIADTLRLPSFVNLKQLEVAFWPNKGHTHIILYLIKRSRFLESLKLRTCEDTCEDIYVDEQRADYPSPPCTYHDIYLHLKQIEMILFRGLNEELKLVESFLHCCPELEKFDIKFTKGVKQHVKRRVKKKAPKFPRLSSTLELTIGNFFTF